MIMSFSVQVVFFVCNFSQLQGRNMNILMSILFSCWISWTCDPGSRFYLVIMAYFIQAKGAQESSKFYPDIKGTRLWYWHDGLWWGKIGMVYLTVLFKYCSSIIETFIKFFIQNLLGIFILIKALRGNSIIISVIIRHRSPHCSWMFGFTRCLWFMNLWSMGL